MKSVSGKQAAHAEHNRTHTTLRIGLAVVVAIASCAMQACNTTKGVGKDIEKAGEGLKNSADKHGAD